MRIQELVSEAGVLGDFKKGYDAGYDAVDRALNPKRWSSDSKDSSESVDNLQLRNSLNLAAQGKTLYLKDQQNLKKVYAEIKAGEFETRQNPTLLLAALKAAANRQQLSPEHQQILAAFAKEL